MVNTIQQSQVRVGNLNSIEIWKSVIGYEGLYEVSNNGLVKSIKRNKIDSIGRSRCFNEVLLNQMSSHSGYLQVNLYKNGLKTYKVHRLVAQSFLPNNGKLPQVNHKDGNKKNNCVDNLEWCSSRDNVLHAVYTGLKKGVKGEKSNLSKLTAVQVNDIRKSTIPPKQLSTKYKVSISTISMILNNKTWVQ